MSRYDPVVRLRHMLDHAKETMDLARGHGRADLDTNRMLSLALVHLLEIVGEAAARVTQPERDKHPAIPWPDIIGLRNRIVHGYDTINLDIVWAIITNDLPPLVAELERILATGPEHGA